MQDAKKTIAQIHAKRQYVDAEAILRLSNSKLNKWIHASFKPATESQTTIDRFFRQ
jgi:hypothetical protein